jgi:hypothetical protein
MKVSIYNAAILPVMLYNMSYTNLTQGQMDKLNTTQHSARISDSFVAYSSEQTSEATIKTGNSIKHQKQWKSIDSDGNYSDIFYAYRCAF